MDKICWYNLVDLDTTLDQDRSMSTDTEPKGVLRKGVHTFIASLLLIVDFFFFAHPKRPNSIWGGKKFEKVYHSFDFYITKAWDVNRMSWIQDIRG